MGSRAEDPNVSELYVDLGWSPGDDTLVLQMSPVLADQVRSLLDEHGLEHGSVLLASADYRLWVESVRVPSAAGGLAALASVINTVLQRHDNKKVLIERADVDKIEIHGY